MFSCMYAVQVVNIAHLDISENTGAPYREPTFGRSRLEEIWVSVECGRLCVVDVCMFACFLVLQVLVPRVMTGSYSQSLAPISTQNSYEECRHMAWGQLIGVLK